MSLYQIPLEPDVDRVWVNEPGGWTEWKRVPDVDPDRPDAHWECVTDGDRHESWVGLLDLGGVSDVHPEVAALPKFPWRLLDGDIESADHATLVAFDKARDSCILDAIVRVMNEWAASR